MASEQSQLPDYARPILGGPAIVAIVLVPWSYAAGLNRDIRPGVPWAALAILAFVLLHITHGLPTLVVMAPGLFIASYLYGLLAQRTGTILPGILIHTAGDLSRTFFGVLKGDAGLLFV